MIDKIAQWLRAYKLNEIEVDNPADDGIVPWDKCSQETKEYWLGDAKEFVCLLTERIKKVENPYADIHWVAKRRVFEEARQAILKEMGK